MFRSYLKITWRSIKKNKVIAVLNIGGLAVGMAVAMLIGVWVWDELSFNKYYKNYDTIAQLGRKEMVNGEIFIAEGSNHFPIPLAAELRTNYSHYFKHVALATESGEQILAFGKNMFTRQGMYVEPQFNDIFSLNIIAGTTAQFTDPNNILLSKSLAIALFGKVNAIGEVLKLNNAADVKVTGVFEDNPKNNRFSGIDFFCPFSLLAATFEQVRKDENNWANSSFNIFVQTVPGADMKMVSSKIKDVYWPKIANTLPKTTDDPPTLFLHPMSNWHLGSEWKNGVPSGGQMQVVWMFSIIGGVVLLLACINFMNLNTARSEKRAREVGIRKTFGSQRTQLVKQFLSESLLVVFIAFCFSILLVYLGLNPFNSIAGKEIDFSFFWQPGVLVYCNRIRVVNSARFWKLSRMVSICFPAGRSAERALQIRYCLSYTATCFGGPSIHSVNYFDYRNSDSIQANPDGSKYTDRIRPRGTDSNQYEYS